jgi:hypothetical protein
MLGKKDSKDAPSAPDVNEPPTADDFDDDIPF